MANASRLPARQDGLLPRPQEESKGDNNREAGQQSRNLQQQRLVQVKRSLHKDRAQQNDRGGDAKNF